MQETLDNLFSVFPENYFQKIPGHLPTLKNFSSTICSPAASEPAHTFPALPSSSPLLCKRSQG